ncbi:MAG: hypothetical protein ACR2FH_09360, partial [Caulobacteraceae bacterium]
MVSQRLPLIVGLLVAACSLASATWVAAAENGPAAMPNVAQSAPARASDSHPIVVAPAGTLEG